MNKEISLDLKNYNLLEKLKIDYLVDAKDQNRWKVAKIVNIKYYTHRPTITLRFDGYPSTWNEDFQLPASHKLAPFRRFTLPYTGPIRHHHFDITRESPDMNFEPHLKELNRLNNIHQIKPQVINQYFRGELFILIDNLLTRKSPVFKEEHANILQLFKAYITGGIKFINFAAQNIKEIGKQAITDPNIVNVSSKYAALHSLAQFLFTFNSLVTTRQNRINFHNINKMKLSPAQSINDLKELLVKNKIIEHCQAILDFVNPPYRGYPWSVKKQALILLKTLKSDIEFPTISDNREVIEILDFLPYLKTKQVFESDFVDKKQIQLIIGLVINGNFQGRLKGINELKKMVEESARYRKDNLKNYIVKTNLLAALTDNSTFNVEIFKRSIPVFEFAQKSDILSPQILNRILNLYKDKHELQLKAFYSALCEFGKFLSKEQILTFFDCLKQFPLDQNLVILIKDYTISVIDHHHYYRSKYQDKTSGLGVVYFWSLIENKKVPDSIKPSIIEAFSALLVNLFYENERQKYITEAIRKIRQRVNVDCYLKIIQTLLKMSKYSSIAKIIKNLQKQGNIIDEVIKAVLDDSKVTAKGMQSMFEFLEEVSSVAQKGITVEHIRILWKMTDCRSLLLKFMRKYRKKGNEKSYEKIFYKQLSEIKIKEIINSIFLSPDAMEGYRVVSDQLYQTADELLISYNHLNRNIEYNHKHTIRCLRAEDIFGLQFYENVAKFCEDEKMAEKAIRRLIEYIIRPQPQKSYFSSSDLTTKVNAWSFCLEKIGRLDKRTFIAYELMLEEIEGRMKSLTILEPTINHITVLYKGTINKERVISLPRYSSLWKLRKIINIQFDLKNTNFQMFYPKIQSTYDMAREEDYSLALIHEPNTVSTTPNVVVTPSKEVHPHQQAIDQFKTHFSNLQGVKLFDFLSVNNSKEQGIILQVLEKIPPIKGLEKKITKLDCNFEEILDSQCRAKLTYQLKLIKDIKSTAQWPQNFIKKRGIEQISKILTGKSGKIKNEHYPVLTQLLEFFSQILKFFKLEKTNLPFGQNFVIELIKPHSQTPSPEISEYYMQIFKVLKELVNYPELKLQKLMSHPAFIQLLQSVLFSKVDYKKWQKFPNIILQISEKSDGLGHLISHMQKFLNINTLLKHRNSCKMFFSLLILMFDKQICNENLYNKYVDFIFHVRKDQRYYEEDEEETDEFLHGWLRMINCLVLKDISFGSKTKFFKEPENVFANFLIHDCLFDTKHRLKSTDCRSQAFTILSNLSCEKQITQIINEMIVPMMSKGSWRKQFQWNVKAFKKRKSGYVGLKNLAATCYINSLLQQLYFIKSFREPLLSLKTREIDDKENIAYEIQKVFAHLKYSDNDVFTTMSLCNTFILDGQPIDPRIQTDVDEFFHTLMDKLQRNFLQIKKKQLIDNVFRGEYSNLIIGQECPHKSERIEHFLSMRLQIIHKKSLHQALDDFIKGQILEGDNAYFCDKCDKKVKALKKVCVKQLPNILILTLKRFEFNFDTMQRFKLNTFCEFPEELDMLPYMRQTLFQDEEKLPPENYQYRLKGILIHYGISQAGHYTSYVKTSDGEWKYFDDERVYDFDMKDLGQECFGGVEQNPYGDDEDKIKNAYLLFYEKITMMDSKVNCQTEIQIQEEVEAENMKNQLVKVLFEEGFEKFLNQKHMTLQKTYLTYIHLVFLRSQNKNKTLTQTYQQCCSIFQKNKQLADWYLSQINESFLREFVIYGCSQAKFFVTSLIIHCLQLATNLDFMKRCIKCIQKHHMVPFNKIFQAASNITPYLKVLNDFSVGEKVYRIIKEDKEPSVTSAISKISDVRSEFGSIPPEFVEKKDRRETVELFLALENFKCNISQEDIEVFARRAKKIPVQISLAKVIAQRYKDKEKFNSLIKFFIGPKMTKFEPKLDEEYIFNFVLVVIMCYCQFKDELALERIKLLVQLYVITIKESLEGYKAMRILIDGLFNIAFSYPVFREEFIKHLNQSKDGKKIVKGMREWIKDADKFIHNVRYDKMGYWKKPSRSSYSTQAQLSQIEADGKIKPQTYLSLLNSLIEKHPIVYENGWTIKANVGDEIMVHKQISLNASEYTGINRYKVIGKMGSLLEVSNPQTPQKFVFQDDIHGVIKN